MPESIIFAPVCLSYAATAFTLTSLSSPAFAEKGMNSHAIDNGYSMLFFFFLFHRIPANSIEKKNKILAPYRSLTAILIYSNVFFVYQHACGLLSRLWWFVVAYIYISQGSVAMGINAWWNI